MEKLSKTKNVLKVNFVERNAKTFYIEKGRIL